jgi:hypothetical protein
MKTRPIKELLQLLLDTFKENDDLNKNGLCYLLQVMNDRGIITREEFHLVNNFIQANRPTSGKFYDADWKDTIHFWPPDDTKTRIEWMECLINEL